MVSVELDDMVNHHAVRRRQVPLRESAEEVGTTRPQRHLVAQLEGIGLEVLIGRRPLLQVPERLNAIVRVAEDAKTENADRDEQDDDSEEGDKELAVDRGGHACDGTHQRVVSQAQDGGQIRGSGRAWSRSSW